MLFCAASISKSVHILWSDFPCIGMHWYRYKDMRGIRGVRAPGAFPIPLPTPVWRDFLMNIERAVLRLMHNWSSILFSFFFVVPCPCVMMRLRLHTSPHDTTPRSHQPKMALGVDLYIANAITYLLQKKRMINNGWDTLIFFKDKTHTSDFSSKLLRQMTDKTLTIRIKLKRLKGELSSRSLISGSQKYAR